MLSPRIAPMQTSTIRSPQSSVPCAARNPPNSTKVSPGTRNPRKAADSKVTARKITSAFSGYLLGNNRTYVVENLCGIHIYLQAIPQDLSCTSTRALFRQATLGTITSHAVDKILLAQAETQGEAVLSDSGLDETHAAAQRLLNRVRLRLQPVEQLHHLAEAIVQKNAGETFKQSLWDYTVLLDILGSEGTVYDAAEKRALLAQNFAAQADIRSKDDVTDWLLIFQGTGKAVLEHALHKWSETASLPWLVVSLAKIDGQHPQT